MQPSPASNGREPVWVPPRTVDPDDVARLMSRWGLPKTVAEVLCRRLGADTSEDAVRAFLKPAFRNLHDPYRYTGMEDAARRLATAVADREQVTVYGDYDVDGATSTALMVDALTRLGLEVHWRIPHRTADGYGLSDRGVELIRGCPGTLVVVLDCGVTAVEQVAALCAEGRDVIVVDHHEPGPELPPALAVLDAKRPDGGYPFAGLSAVGVAFKLLQALGDVLGLPPSEFLLPLLDLVAVGTAADIVPIVDENRVLMRHGLRRLARRPRPGLRALLNVARLGGKPLSTSSIVFGIAPRINAAGRMKSADMAVRLLLEHDHGAANHLAGELNRVNRDRQSADQEVLEMARRQALEQVSAGARGLVLANEEWHPGIIGIVASRLVEEFYLPTVMISARSPQSRGSGRSIEGFDLHSAFGACAEVLIGYGGHVKAAGITIDPERIPEFRERFQFVAAERVRDDMLSPRVYLDANIALGDVTLGLVAAFEKLGPFGPENMRPVLVSRGVRAIADPTILKGAHLRAELEQEGAVRQVIGFNFAAAAPLLAGPVDVAYVAEPDVWQGRKRLQLRLKAIRRAE